MDNRELEVMRNYYYGESKAIMIWNEEIELLDINNNIKKIYEIYNKEYNETWYLIRDKKDASYILKNRTFRIRRNFAKEEINNTQSSLAIACPVYKLTKYERDYALVLGNLIFGGGADSKLFKDVREANSLCYTIRSFYTKMDNMITIKAGIDRTNYTKAITIITKKLDEMKKGKFSDEDINNVKEEFINALESLDEDESMMINDVMSSDILELDDIKTRISTIKKVKKSDIVKAFRKVHMDTVFLLEGVLDEED